MPTFHLVCRVTVSAYTEVEADSLEAAIELAGERSCKIGFNGSGNEPDESWIVEEIDGLPNDIREQ